MNGPFTIQKGSIWAIPITHYSMEMAAEVHRAFHQVSPDCVCVELPESMESKMLQAASRLPDISVVHATSKNESIYYMAEPCDAAFEALRSALEKGIPAHCIDLDVDRYPLIRETLPDPYAIQRIGLEIYYALYKKTGSLKVTLDEQREIYMAKRLKELSLSYDRILFIGGMSHIESVLEKIERKSFPTLTHAEKKSVELCTLTE